MNLKTITIGLITTPYFNAKITNLNPDSEESKKQLTTEQWKELARIIGVRVANKLSNKSKVIRAIQDAVSRANVSKKRLNHMMHEYDIKYDAEQKRLDEDMNNDDDETDDEETDKESNDNDLIIDGEHKNDGNDKKNKNTKRVRFADELYQMNNNDDASENAQNYNNQNYAANPNPLTIKSATIPPLPETLIKQKVKKVYVKQQENEKRIDGVKEYVSVNKQENLRIFQSFQTELNALKSQIEILNNLRKKGW